MKLSQVLENIHKCKNYSLMLDGLNQMIKKAPDNEKKEMLKDVIKFGQKLSKDFERFSGSNEYLQTINFALEGSLEIERRRVKELEILVVNLKRGI